jgi:predicted ATP-grasp superfamily ATP-dependent carboligase
MTSNSTDAAGTVLIAGYSGRALAASARRAGFAPLVVDGYGDADTRTLAADLRVLRSATTAGFRKRSLLEALDELAGSASSPPIGLVLAAGFEEDADLVAALAERYTLLGCGPGTVRAAKDPAVFFPLLESLGILHPETRVTPPDNGRGWLSKRIGGSGGGHVAVCRERVAGVPGRYYQRHAEGVAISMLGVVDGRRAAFAFTRQWTSAMPRRPFRYGGAAGSIDIDADLEARMIDIALDVARSLSLVGIVSLDFLVAGDTPWLIEVNPRPGASLDVLDDAAGTLFNAHLAACRGEDPTEILAASWQPEPSAVAYVYADRAALVAPDIPWPEWTSDRPAPGTTVARYQPIATVHASAGDLAGALDILRERLGTLDQMIYPARQR